MDLPFVNVSCVQTSTQRSAGPLSALKWRRGALTASAVLRGLPLRALVEAKQRRLPPSRVGQRAAIGIATETVQPPGSKTCRVLGVERRVLNVGVRDVDRTVALTNRRLTPGRVGQHAAIGMATERRAATRLLEDARSPAASSTLGGLPALRGPGRKHGQTLQQLAGGNSS